MGWHAVHVCNGGVGGGGVPTSVASARKRDDDAQRSRVGTTRSSQAAYAPLSASSHHLDVDDKAALPLLLPLPLLQKEALSSTSCAGALGGGSGWLWLGQLWLRWLLLPAGWLPRAVDVLVGDAIRPTCGMHRATPNATVICTICMHGAAWGRWRKYIQP